MKKITVVRHAEAGQASIDFDRHLTEYGQSQAKSVAGQLSGLIKPQLLIVSSANRTRDTAAFLIDAFGLSDSDCRFEEKVYEASVEDLRSVIAELPENVSEVVLVGHNPSISSLVSSWTGSYLGFSTACSVVLELSGESWAESVYKPAKIATKVLSKL